MTCCWCGSGRIIGHDDLATCADCARFVVWNTFDLMRVQLTPTERQSERKLRAVHKPTLAEEWVIIPEGKGVTA